MVRGAAPAQLLAEGQLTDTGTTVVPVGGPPADEVHGLVYSEIERARPRDWRPLLHQSNATLAAVEDQLVQATGSGARLAEHRSATSGRGCGLRILRVPRRSLPALPAAS